MKRAGRQDVPNKVYLSEKQIPQQWYNMQADLPIEMLPPLNPQTKEPLVARDLEAIFPKALIEQELTQDVYVDIPDELRRLYATYRPAPLHRAFHLEDKLGTPARIYYKYEGGNTSGSHKLNSALPQAYYNKQAGMRRLATETGAGQWGTALSMACSMFGLDCTVYMVKVSAEQKPFRRAIMETYGSTVIASPSPLTQAGRTMLERDPKNSGSLGTAISEAVEDAASHDDTNYALGSVLNHVIMHQSIIGLEALDQMKSVEEYPDLVIGCCGGGSNCAGIIAPFVRGRFTEGKNTSFIAVEPTACPTLTRGTFAYDFGDTIGLTPLMPQYTLGHAFMPASIHAGGLRYHGAAQTLSYLVKEKVVTPRAIPQTTVFDAAKLFTRTEGLLPAPESAHAIAVAIDEAIKCRETGEEKVILFCLSGHGYYDLAAYDRFNRGELIDAAYTDADLVEGAKCLPNV